MARKKPYCNNSAVPLSIPNLYQYSVLGTMANGLPFVGSAYYLSTTLPATPSAWQTEVQTWWNSILNQWKAWNNVNTVARALRLADCYVPRRHSITVPLTTTVAGAQDETMSVTTLAAFIEYYDFTSRRGGPSGWRAGPLSDSQVTNNNISEGALLSLETFGATLLAYTGTTYPVLMQVPDHCHGTSRLVVATPVNPLVASVEGRKK